LFEIKRSKGLTGLEINCRGWKLGLERVQGPQLEVKPSQPHTLDYISLTGLQFTEKDYKFFGMEVPWITPLEINCRG